LKRRELSRSRSLARRGPSREPRARFLLLCEGRVTEPGYFNFIKSCLRDSLLTIEISKERGDPLRLVKTAEALRSAAERQARRLRDDNLRYDEVWCIFDVDEHPRLEEALALAGRLAIRIAVSNPCFELWPLLHFVDQRAYVSGTTLRNALQNHMPGYDKSLSCEQLRGRYPVARSRAQALREQHIRHGRSPMWNPATDVWVLVEALLAAARKSGVRTRLNASFGL
jgi:hypothetical protein